MRWDELVKEQLRRHEGYRRKPYSDTVGKITIGIGRNLTDVGLLGDEIEFLFANDVARALEIAKVFISKERFNELSEERKAVIVNMAFNLGSRLHNFKRFRFALLDRDWTTAGDELLASKWAQQVGKRAHELANLMRGGPQEDAEAAV